MSRKASCGRQRAEDKGDSGSAFLLMERGQFFLRRRVGGTPLYIYATVNGTWPADEAENFERIKSDGGVGFLCGQGYAKCRNCGGKSTLPFPNHLVLTHDVSVYNCGGDPCQGATRVILAFGVAAMSIPTKSVPSMTATRLKTRLAVFTRIQVVVLSNLESDLLRKSVPAKAWKDSFPTWFRLIGWLRRNRCRSASAIVPHFGFGTVAFHHLPSSRPSGTNSI